MEIIWNICFEAFVIFIFVMCGAELILSLLLSLSPKTARYICNKFNRSVDTNEKLTCLDKPFQTNKLICRYHILVGAVLFSGALYFLFFLFFQMDVNKVLYLFADQKYSLPIEMFLEILVIFGAVIGLVGIVYGLFLVFFPEKIIKIENRMGTWIHTQFVLDRLEKFHFGVDNIFFRHHLFFGFAGLMATLFIIIVFINLLPVL